MKRYYLFLAVLLILLFSMPPFAQASNLADDSVDFSIDVDQLAVMNSEESSLELELEEAELIESNTETNQTNMEIYNNFDAQIKIEQKPDHFNYDILNNGLNYEFELSYTSNGNKEDEIVKFEPGEDSPTVTFEEIDPGRSELVVSAVFDPEKTDTDWWDLPADGEEKNMYEDVLLEITIEESG